VSRPTYCHCSPNVYLDHCGSENASPPQRRLCTMLVVTFRSESVDKMASFSSSFSFDTQLRAIVSCPTTTIPGAGLYRDRSLVDTAMVGCQQHLFGHLMAVASARWYVYSRLPCAVGKRTLVLRNCRSFLAVVNPVCRQPYIRVGPF
jgi:hypothetical protein